MMEEDDMKGSRFYLYTGIIMCLLAFWLFYDSKWLFGILWLILAAASITKDYLELWSWRR